MSKPQSKTKNPDHPGQTKTMFATEGNSTVDLVITEAGATRAEHLWFPDLSHAFEWCRKHRSNFVYCPTAPNN